MAKNLARVRLSTDLILQALAFPEGTTVIACDGERAGYPGDIDLIVHHPDLPVTPELAFAPLTTPIHKLINKPPSAFFEFDWNLPDGD